jgi:bacterioferritin-associated ferredoxin
MSQTDVWRIESEAKSRGPKRRQGLAEALSHGNQCGECLGLEKGRSQAYLGAMTVHFPFQNTYSALPANFWLRPG